MVPLERLFIEENDSIRSAMERLDETALRILLIAPGGKLKAVLTDGDIRRHIIKNGSIDESVRKIATYHPKYVTQETRAEAKSIMRSNSIIAIPLLNEEGVVESLLFADDV
jgi:CBS domain-containing protein